MKLKKSKIFTIVLILIMLFSSFSVTIPVYAGEESSKVIDFGKADDFISKGKASQGIEDLSDIGADFSAIGKVLVYIGAGVIVGGMGYIGIMYMISAPEKRAKLKQQLIGLVVAAIVIFGAYSIWSLLVTILSNTIDPAAK